MANPANLAPAFTRENAGEMARRATKSRLARIAREKAAQELAEIAAREAAPKSDDARTQETLRQIDRLDKLINHALDIGNEERFLALASCKERLWKLVQPTAGSLKPRSKDSRRLAPVAPISPVNPVGESQ